ncbi:hypothetical protein DFJ73DRAFT_810511 [Zopfochytrium polystomum]|nr:hypothetical protein DFJ73DRAFT_810511 [Zopfochytrium polystomum]
MTLAADPTMAVAAAAVDASRDRAQLFGGAIESWIPKSFVDSSTFREVPDNQEVWVDMETDQSMIIELLQLEEVTDVPASFHFWELADVNSARDYSRILRVEHLSPGTDVPHMGPGCGITLVIGQQLISKYRETDPTSRNLVNIYLAVIRLPQVSTDLVISYNHPVALGQLSSSRAALISAGSHPETAALGGVSMTSLVALSEQGFAGRPASWSPSGDAEVLHVLAELERDVTLQNFRNVLRSIAIKDWGLFA